MMHDTKRMNATADRNKREAERRERELKQAVESVSQKNQNTPTPKVPWFAAGLLLGHLKGKKGADRKLAESKKRMEEMAEKVKNNYKK